MAHRDVSYPLQIIRKILQRRPFKPYLRFADDLSARTQPPPNLPEGPHHKLSANYYFTRDARREMLPAEVVCTGSAVPRIEATSKTALAVTSRTPGKVYQWD